MGLSPDPEKRARQQANLRKGWEINASRLDAPDPPAEPPEPEPAAPAGGLEVVPYDTPQADEPAPAPTATRRVRRPAPARPAKQRPEPEPEPGPEPGRRRGALGELAAGFFGDG